MLLVTCQGTLCYTEDLWTLCVFLLQPSMFWNLEKREESEQWSWITPACWALKPMVSAVHTGRRADTRKHTNTHIPAISNDDLWPAWGQACITVAVTNTQMRSLTQIHTDNISPALSLSNMLRKMKNEKMEFCKSSEHLGIGYRKSKKWNKSQLRKEKKKKEGTERDSDWISLLTAAI